MKIRSLYVAPRLPEELAPLRDIARNFWFAWNPEVANLFRDMDGESWEAAQQNPVKTLSRVPQSRLEELAKDAVYVERVQKTGAALKEYMERAKWFQSSHAADSGMSVAYFCCEFGVDASLPIYSGGLGTLAGDHLKSASDLGIPLIGVGLFYREGYFHQRLNVEGWQMEDYPVNEYHNLSLRPVTDAEGHPVTIPVEMRDKSVKARAWLVKVGEVDLYLLDANLPENPPWAREITNRLYGGDRDMRLRQELLLGIGGYRMLKAIGRVPSVFHINEGHSAFLILARMRDYMESEKLSFEEAREIVSASNVFTTHTPVPAGNEQFDPGLLRPYLEPYLKRLGTPWDHFVTLGRVHPGNQEEHFGMTVFALRFSKYANGVSELHGQVSRAMWRDIWPGLPNHEVPITHITNGIHTKTWLHPELNDLLQSYLGRTFVDRPWDFDARERVKDLPDVVLWRTHLRKREQLVRFVRRRLERQLIRRGAQPYEVRHAAEVLNPRALTIGFARRFATYKRAYLLFKDRERLKRLITDKERPLQIIIAGKAHPQDNPGKLLIQSIIHTIREEPFRSSIVFVEDYDMEVGRQMVQGVDVWLNTPRRPLEASGTSGMKAAVNGGLNLSVLDGWWDEGFDPETGWAIGNNMGYDNHEEQDQADSTSLFDCLENEVIPLFYQRDPSDVPLKWTARMKSAISRLGREFNTHRMLREYTESLYLPAHRNGAALSENRGERAKKLAAWRDATISGWKQVEIVNTDFPEDGLRVGDSLPVTVDVKLGGLRPEDVAVEVLFGEPGVEDELSHVKHYAAEYKGTAGADGTHRFSANVPCEESGDVGLAIRVRAHHPDLIRPIVSNCITWG